MDDREVPGPTTNGHRADEAVATSGMHLTAGQDDLDALHAGVAEAERQLAELRAALVERERANRESLRAELNQARELIAELQEHQRRSVADIHADAQRRAAEILAGGGDTGAVDGR